MTEELPSGVPTPEDSNAPRPPRRLAENFRWQSFFQRSIEPIFVLDRRGRLLFVNRAWEMLTATSKEQAHLLVCRRSRAVSPESTVCEILAHALTPPRDVWHGNTGCIRRQLPAARSRAGLSGWWEIEFFPLLQPGPKGGYLIVGRIRPVPPVEPIGEARPFENLAPLRQPASIVFRSMPGPARFRLCVVLPSRCVWPARRQRQCFWSAKQAPASRRWHGRFIT